MPSSSDKQHKFMAAVAHSAEFSGKTGVPMSVGQHFMDKDRTSKTWGPQMRRNKRREMEGARKLDGIVEKACKPKRKMTKYEEMVIKSAQSMGVRALDGVRKAETVLKFNPWHDKSNGRFTSRGGGKIDVNDPRGHKSLQDHIKSFGQTAVQDEDLMGAYSDANEGPGKRNLDFLSSKDYSVDEWASAMDKATPGVYNAFNAKQVGKALAQYPGIKVRPAREYSVGAYVTGPLEQLQSLFAAHHRGDRGTASGPTKADEVDFYAAGHQVKDMSKYTSGTDLDKVPAKHIFSEPVVRLWWD